MKIFILASPPRLGESDEIKEENLLGYSWLRRPGTSLPGGFSRPFWTTSDGSVWLLPLWPPADATMLQTRWFTRQLYEVEVSAEFVSNLSAG